MIMLYEEKIKNSTSFIFMVVGFILILSAMIFESGPAQFSAGGVGLLLLIGSLMHQFTLESKKRTFIEFLCVLGLFLWALIHILLW